jgi:hypothetical protein
LEENNTILWTYICQPDESPDCAPCPPPQIIDSSSNEYQFFYNNWLNSGTPTASLYRNNPKTEYKVSHGMCSAVLDDAQPTFQENCVLCLCVPACKLTQLNTGMQQCFTLLSLVLRLQVVVITGAKEDAAFDGEAHISLTGSWGQTSETQVGQALLW